MTPQAMPYCAHHNCTWIKDMLAHVQIHRVSEFSTSGSGDDVSVFWEPDLSFFTDPFAIHSPTNTQAIVHAPSPLQEFLTPPSSSTGSPDAQIPMRPLDATDVLHESESPPVQSFRLFPKTRRRGFIRLAHDVERKSSVWKDVHKTIMKKDSDIVQPDEQKEDENITAGAGCVGGDAIEAQASQTTGMSTRQIRKRKINDVNGNHGSDTDENVLFPNPVPTVVKRICRERTGTDWQTVLDIVNIESVDLARGHPGLGYVGAPTDDQEHRYLRVGYYDTTSV
ncbi:uncharacterized protein F5891DRAFT_1201910 [Suillus fuscotomentosus]|uniref:Uncharacterized protein n=1 Tax=Suillus fuscotomentosus TaxID=1912939 RepID=A0AAD4DN53_9AGAM|nr:uncharacterized protein F5891DRAFT_1201910 [Suillus fuscotomentosus]KAG1885328.1 hypothetical protein F5891DRAFT_1201910 [Suillus fuscotomentosus]